MDDLEAAYGALWAVPPAGWDVARPVEHVENRYWVSYVRDPHWHKGKATPAYVEAIGPAEPKAIAELARCITEVLAGRVPK